MLWNSVSERHSCVWLLIAPLTTLPPVPLFQFHPHHHHPPAHHHHNILNPHPHHQPNHPKKGAIINSNTDIYHFPFLLRFKYICWNFSLSRGSVNIFFKSPLKTYNVGLCVFDRIYIQQQSKWFLGTRPKPTYGLQGLGWALWARIQLRQVQKVTYTFYH